MLPVLCKLNDRPNGIPPSKIRQDPPQGGERVNGGVNGKLPRRVSSQETGWVERQYDSTVELN